MADEIRVGRPMHQTQRPEGSLGSEYREPSRGSGSRLPWIVLGIVIVAAVILGILFRDKLFGSSNEDTYQAVFLSNGQVYFGKLDGVRGDYATLNDIYYLQVTTDPPLQGQGANQAQAQQRLQLVKLGNELHGPVSEMQINREHILFYEDMKEDGQVMQAIRRDQRGEGNTQTPATNTPATNTPSQQNNTQLQQQTTPSTNQ